MCQGSVEEWVAWKQQNHARGTWFLKMYLWGSLGKECIIWLYSHNSRHGSSHSPCHLAMLWKPFSRSTPLLMWSLQCWLSSFLTLLTHFHAINICRKPEGLLPCGTLLTVFRNERNGNQQRQSLQAAPLFRETVAIFILLSWFLSYESFGGRGRTERNIAISVWDYKNENRDF